MLVGKFFIATLVSLSKNSLPSIMIFFTSFPLMVMVPSSETSAPGNFFTNSSKAELRAHDRHLHYRRSVSFHFHLSLPGCHLDCIQQSRIVCNLIVPIAIEGFEATNTTSL